QVVADSNGEVVHLFERDCSLQRRHQKVIEIAPAPNLDDDLRQRLYTDAVKFAKARNYRNAGTVELLVDTEGERAGGHVYSEMSARIQVEPPVTEEVTDVGLVATLLRIAAGASLDDLDIHQDVVSSGGLAIQCRITSEDPAHHVRADADKIAAYRAAGRSGI